MLFFKKESSLFYNKDFMLLFLGGLVSRTGSSVHYIALIWLVLELTGSGSKTGLLLLLATLPGVLLGPLAGVMVDRMNRKILIVGMDVVRGLVVLWLSYIVHLEIVTFFHLGLSSVIIAISSAFFNPAITATIPNLVEERRLQRANSMEYFSMNITQIIGYALGGLLIAVTGVFGVFLINGISYLLSALSEMFITLPFTEKEEDSTHTLIQDFSSGAGFLYNNKALFSLFSLSIMFNFLFSGIMGVGIPFIFKEILSVESNLFGLAQSIFPAGAILGAIIMGITREVKNFFLLLATTITIQTVILFLLGIPILPGILAESSLRSIYLLLLGLLFLFGFVNAICNVPITVLLQRMIPDSYRGRVFGLIGTLNQGLVPLSLALVGFLLDRTITSYLFFMASGSMIFVIIIGFRLPALRTLQQSPVTEGGYYLEA